jgi:hypothetical protein
VLKCPAKLSAPKRRTRAKVQQLVADFVSSGMRSSEFCQSRGLSFSTLDRYLKKLRWKRRRRPVSPTGQLVKVELAAKKSPKQHDATCGRAGSAAGRAPEFELGTLKSHQWREKRRSL